MAGVYEGFENEVGKGTELQYAYYFSQPPIGIMLGVDREIEVDDSREKKRNGSVGMCQECVKIEAPPCLIFKSDTYKKLFPPRVYTEWFRKSCTFSGIFEWNRLPFEIVCLDSSSASFRVKLRAHMLNT